MAKDLANLVVTLELQSAKYQQGFDQATKRLEKFHKDTGESLKGIAELFAGYLSAEAILEFAKKTIEASSQLAEFSKSAGVSVEALSALQFAAKAGGVGTDELNTSLKKLNVAISDTAGGASSKAAVAFGLLGINVKNANGSLKDANQVFNEVADKFAKTEDGANKVAIAVALFGKAGQAMIPTLDKGSAGLKELADQAAAAGAVIDGPTAEAAKAFTEKLNVLKATLVDGLGATIEKKLLPVLNDLASQFLDTAHDGENLKVFAEQVTSGFRLLISGGLAVKQVFSELGDAIGGALAAVGAALKGNFAEAGRILDDQHARTVKSEAEFVKNLAGIWQTDGSKYVAAVDDTVGKTKKSLGSLAGALAAQAAMKELEAFVGTLQDEFVKLDQGKVAATNYALSHGKLADALKLTGAAGKQLALDAISVATKIETQAITKQLEGLESQLKALSGDAAGAALDNFSKSVEQLERQLKDVGGATQANGQAIIDALKQATVYQQTFNTLQTQAARINADAAEKSQAVADAQANGALTTLQAEKQLQAIRADTIAQLQGIKNGEDSIAAAANNPALTQGAKAFGASLDHLKSQTDTLTTQIRGDLQNAFENDFLALETGAASFGQTFHKLAIDIQNDLLKIANKNLAESIFGGSGAGSSIPGMLAGLFGGGGGGAGAGIASTGAAAVGADTGALASSIPAFADGGILPANKIGLVGENGPELITGAAGGTNVIPNGQGLGSHLTVHNSFVIQSQNGQISRQSQQQVAAAAARSLGQANARNNRG